MPTIGVAIAIPEPYGDELREARLRCGDPLATAIPTHVTLLPPTEVDPAAAQAIDEHLKKVADDAAAIQHASARHGYFPACVARRVRAGRRRAWSSASDWPRRCAAVRSPDGSWQFPYHPHVTIAHDTPEPALDLAFDELADYEAEFAVDGFSLYRHGADGVWRAVRAYAFGDARTRRRRSRAPSARSSGG